MFNLPKLALRSLAASALGLLTLVAFALPASATPAYSLRAANACDTCHIEPLGWNNPDDTAKRLCTMDCNGCHVSPSGGGMRTPSGRYYGLEVLPTWGSRPSTGTNPEQYRPKGYPKKGRYSLFDGFSGWWAGNVDFKTIKERYGNDIDPDPTFDWGADYRGMLYIPLDEDEDVAGFPMQAELYGMAKPHELVTVYATAGIRGSRTILDGTGAPGVEYGYTDKSDYLSVREAWVKLGRFDYNSYVRAGRFAPAYGWRLPDHTAMIRRDLGFDQNRQVYGVEASINPNYPYATVAGFVQGLEDWPGDNCNPIDDSDVDCSQQGYGMAATAGYRALGWSVGGSIHYLDRSGESEFGEAYPGDLTAGVNWGANLYPVVYMGEVDVRQTLHSDEGREDSTALFAYHELNWLALRGVNLRLKYDWRDNNIDFKSDAAHRLGIGGDWHMYSNVHLETQYRMNFTPDFDDGGEIANGLNEVFFIFHFFR